MSAPVWKLCASIVSSAVNDDLYYKLRLIKLKKYPNSDGYIKAQYNSYKLDKFFRSTWFEELSRGRINYDWILSNEKEILSLKKEDMRKATNELCSKIESIIGG